MPFNKSFVLDHAEDSTSQKIKNQVFVEGSGAREDVFTSDQKSNSSQGTESDPDVRPEHKNLDKPQIYNGLDDRAEAEYKGGGLSGRPYQVRDKVESSVDGRSSVLAFPSVILSDVRDHNTTIYGDYIYFNSVEQDLMGSLSSAGAVIGVWFSSLFGKCLGKRRILMCLSLAGLFSWVAIALSPDSTLCLAFRVLNGCVYGGVSVTGLSYIIEATDDVMRGPLTVGGSASISIGQVLSVVPAYWLRYYQVAFVDCVFPILFFVCSVFLMPDSPTALVLAGHRDKARRILTRLHIKGVDVDAQIKGFEEINKLHQEANVFRALTSPKVIQRLGIVFVLFIIQVFSGYTIFVAQTARILEDSGSTVEATLSTFLVQASQLFGICISVSLVRRLGRRGCLLVSHFVMAVSVALLAVFVLKTEQSSLGDSTVTTVEPSMEAQTWLMPHGEDGETDSFYANWPISMSVRWLGDYIETMSVGNSSVVPDSSNDGAGNLGWVPLACLFSTQLGAAIGVQSIPFILSSEYFPTAIRAQAASICVTWAMVLGVISLQMYSPLQAALTQAGLLFLHCAVSVLALPFTFFVVQETVGKSVG
ncbi:Major facilitator sugar transporter-like [Trinorchestia longiramus]|nr:Major facilitator sugar transporter-like [Trinorchestia longiramus]